MSTEGRTTITFAQITPHLGNEDEELKGNGLLSGQHSLLWSIFLHLAPGAILAAFMIVAAPILSSWGIDPIVALFAGILVPLELGYLAMYSRRTTGSWSPLGAVTYRARPRAAQLALLSGCLTVWFLLCLVVSIAFLDEWLAQNIFAWIPDALLQFSAIEQDGEPLAGTVLIPLLLMAFLFNGIAGPVTEELYFRGHLLPRLERYGRLAPVINTVLFGIYHFFSPWRYPAIILGFLPITWMSWRKRSVAVSIAAHVTINIVTVLLLLASVLAAAS